MTITIDDFRVGTADAAGAARTIGTTGATSTETASGSSSAGTASTWVRACTANDLEPFWGEAVLFKGQQLAVFKFSDGSFAASSNVCPATGSSVMARGIVGATTIDGAHCWTIASPLHKEIYRLDEGSCLNKAGLQLPVYPVRVIDGALEIMVAI